MPPLLQVRGLRTYFFSGKAVVPAVDGIDFDLDSRQSIGIVGESGCGKSVTSLSIMRLIPPAQGRIVAGQILFQGQDLVRKTEKEMCQIRGKDIAMVFQEPLTSLNPVITIGAQVTESLRIHQSLSKKDARGKAVEMLKLVGIPMPAHCLRVYPHQLSGGMRQRVMIAIALSCHPKVLIADEPTTALDVTIQNQILDLLDRLRSELNMPIIMITHDLGIIAELADQVLVMYCGRIVEGGDVDGIFSNPLHPYTVGLMKSLPRVHENVRRLSIIPGMVPNLAEMPSGCRFHPRCVQAKDICRRQSPERIEMEKGRYVSCWLYN